MAESKAIQSAVIVVVIQAATATVMALREADAGPRSGANTAIPREVHRERHGGPALKEPRFT